MTENRMYPYTLEIAEKSPGLFQWSIRVHGRLLQRADRSFPSERLARQKGEEVIERVFGQATRGSVYR
jgi:hypothetical protein